VKKLMAAVEFEEAFREFVGDETAFED